MSQSLFQSFCGSREKKRQQCYSKDAIPEPNDACISIKEIQLQKKEKKSEDTNVNRIRFRFRFRVNFKTKCMIVYKLFPISSLEMLEKLSQVLVFKLTTFRSTFSYWDSSYMHLLATFGPSPNSLPTTDVQQYESYPST